MRRQYLSVLLQLISQRFGNQSSFAQRGRGKVRIGLSFNVSFEASSATISVSVLRTNGKRLLPHLRGEGSRRPKAPFLLPLNSN